MIDIMQFWFVEWCIKEKNLDFEKYTYLTELELEQLKQEFRDMFKNI